MAEGRGRSHVVRLREPCARRCATCECHEPAPSGEDAERLVAAGGGRLVIRTPPGPSAELAELVDRARRAGFGEVAVRAHAHSFDTPEKAEALRRLGVDAAILPVLSQAPAVHDRITGSPQGLARTLLSLRCLGGAGVLVRIEVPLLAPRLQDLGATLELALRAVPALDAVRFHAPMHPVPDVLAPPAWDEAGPALARAVRRAREAGARVEIAPGDGVPFCAMGAGDDVPWDAFRFDPRKPAKLRRGAERPAASCSACAVRAHCPGVPASYARAHGTRGLAALAQRPRALYWQRTTGPRVWSEEQKEAARRSEILVLRPTVHCNQDCGFCSANETSANNWGDPGAMLRQIARAARRGVEHLSFSGGEPTLVPELPEYVAAASRLGIERIELITNATLLDGEKRVGPLVRAGLTDAFVSLHGHTETVARLATAKVGDFERTVRGIELLLARGVRVMLNHVVTTANHRYLEAFVRFVHARFGGRTPISFAFVTPQYRALDNMHLLPRISDVVPTLRAAMRTALSLDQPFVVGARQGIPPCFLGAFQAWSDLLHITNAAMSEDSPQKRKAPACEQCRYRRHCPGLWTAYVERFGTDEIRPMLGEPLDDAQVREALALCDSRGVIVRSFDQLPAFVRDPEDEARLADESLRDVSPEPAPEPPPEPVRLPVLSARTRPVRLLFAGSGNRARRLAREAARVPGIAIDAVASPHAPDGDRADFGGCPAYRDVEAALDDRRPEGIVIAASTLVHHAIAKLALARGVPILLEKPVATTLAQAEEIVAEVAARGALAMAAHNALYPAGLATVLAPDLVGSLRYERRLRATSPDAPRSWDRAALYETLYHSLVVLGRGAGGGVAEVRQVQQRGVTAPERVRVELAYPGGLAASLLVDFGADEDHDRLDRPEASLAWQRRGREVELLHAGVARPVERDGSELAKMLGAFRDLVVHGGPSPVPLAEGLDVMRTARAVIVALEQAGAPFARPDAPKHVASAPFRERIV